MAVNKNWPRWIFASVSKHFDAEKNGLKLFIEGQHRDTREDKDFLEFRLDGPYITEVSHNYFRLYIEVNVLVQSTKDQTSYHRIHENVGIAAAAFWNGIKVFKYGDGVGDDDSYLGCLRLVTDARGKERIQISHFGQIEPKTRLLQATVEGHYEMFLQS